MTNVARASLEELLLDYEDFLRQRQLKMWTKDSEEAKTIRNILPPDEPSLPQWVAGVYWIYLITLWTIILLNWKYGLVVYILKFILSILPVLEIIGNVLISPFKPKRS